MKGEKKPKPCLFSGGIDAGDIQQGELGDCWLMSALACLAERRGAIEGIFLTKQYNPFGKYKVRLFDPEAKAWTTVTIDDRIPCNQLGEPLYARSGSEDEMWVMLLEKGYAKLHRNYENLKTGFVDYALRDLTGGNSQQIKWAPPETDDALATKSDEVWKDILFILCLYHFTSKRA